MYTSLAVKLFQLDPFLEVLDRFFGLAAEKTRSEFELPQNVVSASHFIIRLDLNHFIHRFADLVDRTNPDCERVSIGLFAQIRTEPEITVRLVWFHFRGGLTGSFSVVKGLITFFFIFRMASEIVV